MKANRIYPFWEKRSNTSDLDICHLRLAQFPWNCIFGPKWKFSPNHLWRKERRRHQNHKVIILNYQFIIEEIFLIAEIPIGISVPAERSQCVAVSPTSVENINLFSTSPISQVITFLINYSKILTFLGFTISCKVTHHKFHTNWPFIFLRGCNGSKEAATFGKFKVGPTGQSTDVEQFPTTEFPSKG